jgi:hypothetical protein
VVGGQPLYVLGADRRGAVAIRRLAGLEVLAARARTRTRRRSSCPWREARARQDAKKIADAAARWSRSTRLVLRFRGGAHRGQGAFDAGNLDEARKQLEVGDDKGVDVHRGVARMRLAASCWSRRSTTRR